MESRAQNLNPSLTLSAPGECSFVVPAFRESFEPQTLDPEVRSSFSLDFTNDNIMLGLVPIGNDEGYTHALGFIAQRRLSDDFVLTVRFATELYTRRAVGNADFDEQLLLIGKVDPETGKTIPGDEYYIDGTPVQFVDVERLFATLSHNGQVRLHVTAGIERRATSPLAGGRLPPAAKIQDTWHRSLELYTYEYIPSQGSPTVAHTTANGEIELEQGYRPDRTIQKISPLSFFQSLLVEKDLLSIGGVCDVSVAGELLVASEGVTALSPNSYVSGSVVTQTVLLRKHKGKDQGRALLSISGSAGLRVTPQGFGTSAGVGIASYPRVVKGKVLITPYMNLWYPGGRQTFDHLNDLNTIQQFGLRFQLK